MFVPVPPSPAFPLVAWQGRMHSSVWGELVQGNEAEGNYLLVWDVFCGLALRTSYLQREGRYLQEGGWGCPGRHGTEVGIPGSARLDGLKIQGMSRN